MGQLMKVCRRTDSSAREVRGSVRVVGWRVAVEVDEVTLGTLPRDREAIVGVNNNKIFKKPYINLTQKKLTTKARFHVFQVIQSTIA